MSSKNCFDCYRYLSCTNPKKGLSFSCEEFTLGEETPVERVGDEPEADEGMSSETIPTDSEEQHGHFAQQMDEILHEQENNPLPVDIAIDDREFPLAKNFVDFTLDPYFSGLEGMTPFARQLQVGANLFSEWCATCTSPEFVSPDPFPQLEVPIRWTPEQFKENIQLLDWGVCPKCGVTKAEQHKKGTVPLRTALNGVAGQRSGKSVTFAMLTTYLTHAMMKLQNPAVIYRQMPTTVLHGKVTALTKKQAADTLWAPLREQMLSSPWFQGYFALLKGKERQLGKTLINIKDTFFDIRCRNIMLAVVTPDMKTLRGGTSYFGGIDELGLFDAKEGNTKVRDNADEVYQSLSNSLRTLKTAYVELVETGNFNYLVAPFMGSISSPINKRDKMMRIHEDAKNDPFIYSFHYPTWEFNPYLPREALEDEYKKNPIKAQRDYGAMPPNSAYPFITDINHLAGCLGQEVRNRWKIQPVEVSLPSGQTQMSGNLISVIPKDNNKRIMALDAGRSDNSYSLCLGYFDVGVNKPVIDGVLELIPRDHILNLHLLYEDIIQPLIKEANVHMFVVDRWQSFQLVDMINNDDEILAKNYSVKYRDFSHLRELCLSGGIELPDPEIPIEEIVKAGQNDYRTEFQYKPVAHLLSQFMTVQDTGSVVEKGNKMTDDTFRAFVLLIHFLTHPEYREYCQGTTAPKRPKRTDIGIAFSGLSTGGGGGAANFNDDKLGINIASRS